MVSPVFFTLDFGRGIVVGHEIRGRLRLNAGNHLLVLALGLFLFIGLHLLRELGWRNPLITRFGLGPYKGLISLGVALSIFLIVLGKGNAPFIQVWVPPFSLRSITHLLMISSCILVLAGALPNSYTRELIGHPMLVGVIVWGVSHLLSNGDLASVLLFGALGLWALFKIFSLEFREENRSDKENPRRASLIWDGAAIILGMIAYMVLLVFHGPLFGFALTAFN
jgi:uncharacterized membrane protein